MSEICSTSMICFLKLSMHVDLTYFWANFRVLGFIDPCKLQVLAPVSVGAVRHLNAHTQFLAPHLKSDSEVKVATKNSCDNVHFQA